MLSTTVKVTMSLSGHTYQADFQINKDGTVKQEGSVRPVTFATNALWFYDDIKEVEGLLKQEALELGFKHLKGEWPCDE